MSQLTIKDYRNLEYTSVSNQFIDSYMADANDAQLKVYLYLLRHSDSRQEISVSALADYFNYTEKDILRALSYWQDKGVLKVDYNESNQPVEIMLCALSLPPSPAQETAPYGKAKSACDQPQDAYTKPDYTLNQLAEFKNRESTSQLLFIAESYLGKTLSSGDIRTLLFISDQLHFSFDLIDYLLQYCIDRGKKDFRYIEKVAISWAQAHITSPSQAQLNAGKYDKQVYTVMNALGKSANPTPKETEYIKKWYQVYGFSADIILEACERTVLATDKHRFEYADKILSSWKAAGVCHKPDIAKADAAFGNRKKNASASFSSRNKFNQFQQNDYDFDVLEQELLSN